MLTTFLTIVPGSYFNAAMVCFFAQNYRKHGLTFNPGKAAKGLWPLVRAILLGIAPATFVGTLSHIYLPYWPQSPLILALLGATISACLLHRTVLSEANGHAKWNRAIVIFTIAQVSIIGGLDVLSS